MKEPRQGGTSPADLEPFDDIEETGDAQSPHDGPAAAADEDAGELRHQRDDYRDRLLRTTAEFDNYRKRTERERLETSSRAVAAVLEDLLPILDDFERALGADPGPDGSAYREGVSIIHKQLVDLLTRRGVRPIDAVGQPFDPRYHQAVVHEHAPGHEDGDVLEELRRGYMLGDRLLRPSMVKVAKA